MLAMGLLAACAPTPKRTALVVGESPCISGRFDVYFVENQARLTDAATLLLQTAADKTKDCHVKHVRVLGLADATGTVEANLSLSQRRARAVAEALTKAGMPAPAFEVNAAGDVGAVNASGADELLRRRAEVFIETSPR
jgi:outer membrane protein OmpA-like peptidoglycan-associated protein